jgi:hypothetical protein
MTTIAWIIMDENTKDTAEALNDGTAAVEGRYVDNPLSANLGLGVTIYQQWVMPARVLNAPLYERWVPVLGALPIRTIDSDVLFIPED